MSRIINHEAVIDHLSNITGSKHYLIAYSGGLDSCVLLHLMHKGSQTDTEINLSAIHINHKLSYKSDEWSDFCRVRCDEKNIPYQSVIVNIDNSNGESIEAVARQSRYRALADKLQYKQVLLTAHHEDDQCETVILQLLRGSGMSGIAAMPEVSAFASGLLARPLLQYDRQSIRNYAIEEGISWIEDDSNSDINRDRNFLRHHIVPVLKKRWPSASRTISRSAKHAYESISLSNSLGKQDFIKCRILGTNVISIQSVQQFDYIRQKNLLRCWIREHNKPVPPANILERIILEVFKANDDRNPLVSWDKTEVRRYHNCIYIMDPLPLVDNQLSLTLEQSHDHLPLGKLEYQYTFGAGINRNIIKDKHITIKFRVGGETIIPAYSSYPHRINKLMSEYGFPPWLRDLIPLIYINHELVAIPGICIDRSWAALAHEPSLYIFWDLPEWLTAQKIPLSKP